MTVVVGTPAAETIGGSTASNILTGGAGHDSFVYFRSQTDTVVTDFGSTYFAGPIAGAQEVPPIVSAGSGAFTGVLNRTQTKFDFTATVSNLDFAQQTPSTIDNITAAHFHRAAPGVSGGVVYGFFGLPNNELDGETTVNPASGVITGQWDANEGNAGATLTSQIPFLLTNQTYINFHTAVFPAGEIRGQVVAQDLGLDRIDLRDAHIGDFATAQLVMRDVSGSVHITTVFNGQASTMILQGVPLSAVTAADFIFSDSTNTTVAGTANADDLFGAGGADALFGDNGADRLWGGLGDDNLSGGDGNDTALAQAGGDTVDGGAGADVVQGNAGADSVMGGAGNDSVYGGRDADTVFGDAGDDRLSGDLGLDVMLGGAGADRFAFGAGSGRDWAVDFSFAAGDRILLPTGTAYTVSALGGSTLIDLGGGDVLGLTGVSSTSFTADFVVFG